MILEVMSDVYITISKHSAGVLGADHLPRCFARASQLYLDW